MFLNTTHSKALFLYNFDDPPYCNLLIQQTAYNLKFLCSLLYALFTGRCIEFFFKLMYVFTEVYHKHIKKLIIVKNLIRLDLLRTILLEIRSNVRLDVDHALFLLYCMYVSGRCFVVVPEAALPTCMQ